MSVCLTSHVVHASYSVACICKRKERQEQGTQQSMIYVASAVELTLTMHLVHPQTNTSFTKTSEKSKRWDSACAVMANALVQCEVEGEVEGGWG